MKGKIKKYILADDGTFPNSQLPVLHYQHVLDLSVLFPTVYAKKLFRKNGWTNNWRDGIYTVHHYHSITHEAVAVINGYTTLMLGGDNGQLVAIEKGDVLIIPAGVAHKNMGAENDVVCVGGYPGGKDFDMNYGKPGERPGTDQNIAMLSIPDTDPVFGKGVLTEIWLQYKHRQVK